MPQKKKLPFVTVGFVAVNVLVYVILEILGNTENSEFMVRMGAVWPPYVKQGEYWRLFTATFMHFGFEHILNNMLVLICAGPILEKFRNNCFTERFFINRDGAVLVCDQTDVL